MEAGVRVCWLFSPIRSGSSITAYAAAHALGCPVADEIFGPWDRTGAPYGYPAGQRRLRDRFIADGERLTAESAALARDLLIGMGSPSGVVICKHPHASIGPEDVRARWPGHASVVLMRNPLAAINSLFVRGWEAATGGGSMMPYFRVIGERWLADPNRLAYEDLRRDPGGYFRRLFAAWGFGADGARVERAVAYRASTYHSSSLERHAGDDPARVRSERAWRVPGAIVEEYLGDPFMRGLFAEAGWSLEREDYLPSASPA